MVICFHIFGDSLSLSYGASLPLFTVLRNIFLLCCVMIFLCSFFITFYGDLLPIKLFKMLQYHFFTVLRYHFLEWFVITSLPCFIITFFGDLFSLYTVLRNLFLQCSVITSDGASLSLFTVLRNYCASLSLFSVKFWPATALPNSCPRYLSPRPATRSRLIR